MKIVRVDNFARDNVSDRLVADNIKHEKEANIMCEALRNEYSSHPGSDSWFVVKPDDYELFKWEP